MTVRRNAGWVQCRDDFFHGLLNYAAKTILSPAAGRFSKPPEKVAMVPRNLTWTTTCTFLFAWVELASLFGFGHRHTAPANLAASPSAALTLRRAKSERTRPQDHKPPVLRRLPEFSLTDHHSRPFGTDQLRGNAWIADFIRTRDPDAVSQTATLAMLQKELMRRPGWLDIHGNGLGARVTVRAGPAVYTKVQDGQSGYLSQSRYPLYFGLGEAKQADQVEVTWPSGTQQVLPGPIAAGSELNITEP